MARDYYLHGSNNVICDVCGWKYKASELKQRWDGLKTCLKCYETRHPQDFVRGVADMQAPAYTRPESQDSFVQVCTLVTQQGAADIGTVGCATVGKWLGYWPTPSNTGSSRTSVAGLAIAGLAIAGTV